MAIALVEALRRVPRSNFCSRCWNHRDELVGLAPWYCSLRKRQLLFLGSGSVCSDHLTILISNRSSLDVTNIISLWLINELRKASIEWDCVALEAIDDEDTTAQTWLQSIQDAAIPVHHEASHRCWVLPLAGGWDTHLSLLRKNARKELKTTYQALQQQQVSFIAPDDDVKDYMEILIRLHQKRWTSLGEPGCFADVRFESFLRDVAEGFHRTNQLWVSCIEHAGQPIAADFALVGKLCGTTRLFCYQAGIDPDFLHLQPGKLSNVALLHRACEEGITAVDFLRGDEPYKKLLHAEPHSASSVRIIAPGLLPTLREQVRQTGTRLRQLGKEVKVFVSKNAFSFDGRNKP